MKILANEVAIVTGGGSGIGKAISLLYAAEGAKVVVSDIDEKTEQRLGFRNNKKPLSGSINHISKQFNSNHTQNQSQ